MCDCKIGLGKFEGEPVLTFLAWDSACNGFADETTGSVDATDWLRGPFAFSDDSLDAARAYGYCETCIREASASRTYGVAVWESEQGFVYGREFATAEEFDATLEDAQAEDAAPEIHVFELNAHEVARQDGDAVWEFSKRREFRLCHMNGRVQDDMLDAMVSELGIKGGWFYRLGDEGDEQGPFETRREAQNAAEREVEG